MLTIRQELETRLFNWVQTQTPPVDIAFEGVKYDRQSKPFVQPIMLKSSTVNPAVDATTKRTRGIFQVNCWAKSGKGVGVLETLADAITDLYPVTLKTSTLSIEGTPDQSQVYNDGDWSCISISIQYRREH